MNIPRPIPDNRFLLGKIYASNDLGAIQHALSYGGRVIVIVDVNQKNDFPGCVLLSNLLPPPDVITEFLDGNVPRAIQLYKAFLADVNREDTIVHILAALHHNPNNLLIYSELESDREFHILETIISFFKEAFGIAIGWYGNPDYPSISLDLPEYHFIIADLLFVNDLIDIKDYAIMTPVDALPSPRAAHKILQITNYGFRTIEEAMRFVLAILNDIRIQAQTGLINPIMFVDPQLPQNSLEELYQRRTEFQVLTGRPL